MSPGPQVSVPCRVRDDRVPRVVHVGEVPARAFLAVHARDHRRRSRRRTRPAVTSTGPMLVAKSLPFAGPSPTASPRRWRSRADQSFMTVKPAILAVWPDDRRDLELVVELVRTGGEGISSSGPVDRRRVREVEDRQLVPLGRHLLAAQGARRLDVLLERVEVAHRRRVQDRRTEVDVGERILRVPPRVSAAGEVRLQRLRCELDDACRPRSIPGQPRRAAGPAA